MASDAQKTNLKHVHFPKIKITKPHFHKPQISKPDFTPVREFLRELSGRLYTLRWRAAMRLRCLPALPQPPRPLAAAICLVGLLVVPMGLALKPTYEITLDDTVIGYVADPSAAQLASNLLETSIASPIRRQLFVQRRTEVPYRAPSAHPDHLGRGYGFHAGTCRR